MARLPEAAAPQRPPAPPPPPAASLPTPTNSLEPPSAVGSGRAQGHGQDERPRHRQRECARRARECETHSGSAQPDRCLSTAADGPPVLMLTGGALDAGAGHVKVAAPLPVSSPAAPQAKAATRKLHQPPQPPPPNPGSDWHAP
eukprot:9584687-Alexandrium_andersonii.AAC.1